MDTSSLDSQVLKMYDNGESTHTIANALNTYPNKILRILRKHGKQTRSKREAQQNAASQGRYKHPMEGKHHTDEAKNKISDGVHSTYGQQSAKVKEARRKRAQKNWNSLPAEKREEMQAKAHAAIRRAADDGSKMELFLVDYLMTKGKEVIHHSEHKVGVENMEIDILLPVERIAVEIDGPSHFLPIWGEDSLHRNRVADNKKNGLLLAGGFHVVRIRDKSKKITRKIERDLIQSIEDAIQKLAAYKKPQILTYEVG